jgi:hypothetical protein
MLPADPPKSEWERLAKKGEPLEGDDSEPAVGDDGIE